MLRAFVEQISTPAAPLRGESTESGAGEKKQDSDVLLQHVLEANLWLQEYEKDLTGFLAQTAHDLGAPLVRMSGYCGLLLDRRMGPLNSEQFNTLEKMQRSAKRMTWLTDGMMQISMGRDLSFAHRMKSGDIRELILQALNEVKPAADAKQVKLDADVTPPAEPLKFELRQIEHVVVNLLDQACRLSSRGGSVHIRAFPTFWDWRSVNVRESHSNERRSIDVQRSNAYRVEVQETSPCADNRDTGRGVPTSGSSAGKGSFREGIGIAICRHVMSAHNGQVFTGNSEQGTILGFVLPFEQGKARQPAPLPKVRTAG
jgi:signal transduction histidine kinase